MPSTKQEKNRAHLRLLETLSFIIGIIGFLVLLGWALHIRTLQSVFPSLVPMKANTALAFILVSLSLLLLTERQRGFVKRYWLGKFFAFIVFLIGILTFFEHIFSVNYHIDQLLFQQTTDNVSYFPPGRMAPLSSVAFTFTGMALLLLDIKMFSKLVQYSAFLIGIFGLFVLIAFTYHTYTQRPSLAFAQVSIHAAINFILIALCLLLLRPTEDLMALYLSEDEGGKLARRLVPAVIIVPVVLEYLRLLGQYENYYDSESGTAFLTTSIIIILIHIVLIAASKLKDSDLIRKGIEHQLHQSFNAIDDLYQHAPCGYYSLSAEGKFVRLNQTLLNWLGYNHAELMGRPFTFILSERSILSFKENFARLKKEGFLENVEYELVRKDKSTFITLLSSTSIQDKTGKFLMSRSTLINIDERKRMEQEMAQIEERWEFALESANQGVWDWYVPEKIMYFSKAWKKMLGYEDKDIRNSEDEFTSHIHPDDLEKVMRRISEHFQGKTSEFQCEVRFLCKDGHYKWILARGKVIVRDVDGSVLRAIGTHTDIDVLKTNEQRLQDALIKIETSNQELQQFANVVSHDLQEPLRTITSYIQLLENKYKNNLDDRANEYIEFVTEGTQRMQLLINDLLNYARIETKAKPFSPVDCNQILKHVLDALHAQIESRHAEITTDKLPVAMADDVQINQVFQNLISNALKFCEGKPKVKISVKESEHDWLISIADNGIGIEVGEAKQIFVAFKRLHSEEQYAGTGLGLAITKKIIERHGGTIGVNSQPGVGSTFFFSLPKRELKI